MREKELLYCYDMSSGVFFDKIICILETTKKLQCSDDGGVIGRLVGLFLCSLLANLNRQIHFQLLCILKSQSTIFKCFNDFCKGGKFFCFIFYFFLGEAWMKLLNSR